MRATKPVGQYLVRTSAISILVVNTHGICNYYLHVDMHCAESEVLLARK